MGPNMKLYAYLAGPVEFEANSGIEWRQSIEKKLKKFDILCFSPMKKPDWLPESAKLNPKEYANVINKEIFYKKEGKDLGEEFGGLRIVRKYCLQMINISDIAVCRLPNMITAGTYEELAILKNCGKPVFFFSGPDKKIAGWVYSMFRDPSYYSETEDEVVEKIKYKLNHLNEMPVEEKLQWVKLTYWL